MNRTFSMSELRAFTLIEAMIVVAILMIITAIAVGVVCEPGNKNPKPIEEQKLNMGLGMYSRIIVLPTSERVLLITGSDGLATCCLLPPLPKEAKVEQ